MKTSRIDGNDPLTLGFVGKRAICELETLNDEPIQKDVLARGFDGEIVGYDKIARPRRKIPFAVAAYVSISFAKDSKW